MLCDPVVLVDASPQIEHQIDDLEDSKGMSAELPVDLSPISLRALNVVSSHIPHIQTAREQIVGEMEAMLVTGVQELVRISII